MTLEQEAVTLAQGPMEQLWVTDTRVCGTPSCAGGADSDVVGSCWSESQTTFVVFTLLSVRAVVSCGKSPWLHKIYGRKLNQQQTQTTVSGFGSFH